MATMEGDDFTMRIECEIVFLRSNNDRSKRFCDLNSRLQHLKHWDGFWGIYPLFQRDILRDILGAGLSIRLTDPPKGTFWT